MDGAEPIDDGDVVRHGGLDPPDGLDDALMLVRQRPIPDGLVMEDAVAKLAHLIEPFAQVDPSA